MGKYIFSGSKKRMDNKKKGLISEIQTQVKKPWAYFALYYNSKSCKYYSTLPSFCVQKGD